MVRILFVCSGNICRSPMAAAMTEARLREAGVEALIISAGTLNIVGRAAASQGVAAVAELGFDLSSHRSQGLSAGFVEAADHVVVMAPRHERGVLALAPDAGAKIVRLWEFAATEVEYIEDPVGRDLDAFRTCRDELVGCLDAWLPTLS